MIRLQNRMNIDRCKNQQRLLLEGQALKKRNFLKNIDVIWSSQTSHRPIQTIISKVRGVAGMKIHQASISIPFGWPSTDFMSMILLVNSSPDTTDLFFTRVL